MGRPITALYENESEVASLSELVPTRVERIKRLQNKPLTDLFIVGLNFAGLFFAYQASLVGLRVLVVDENDLGVKEGHSQYQKPKGILSQIKYRRALISLKSQAPLAVELNPQKGGVFESLISIFQGTKKNLFKAFNPVFKSNELLRALALATTEEGGVVINYVKPQSVRARDLQGGFNVELLDTQQRKEIVVQCGVLVTTESNSNKCGFMWRSEPGRAQINFNSVVDAFISSRTALEEILFRAEISEAIPNLTGRLLPNQRINHSEISRFMANDVSEADSQRAIALLGSRSRWVGEEPLDFEMHKSGVLQGVVRVLEATELVTSEADLFRRISKES